MLHHRTIVAVLSILSIPAWVSAQPIFPANTVTLNDNGGWCWFEGERAVIDRTTNTLLLSTVANAAGTGGAARSGNVEVVSYGLGSGLLNRFNLSPNFQADDHNSAALYIRPDGRYVASYAKHGSDNFTRWRVSTNPGDATNWGPAQSLNNGAGTTYSNIYNLSAENGGAGRTYNFTRSVGFNPNLNVSLDHGSTWSYGGRLLQGPGRPYVNYTSNGVDKIWLTATEQHPRNFNNSIYVATISNGQLRRTDGTIIDSNLFDGLGASPTALTKIFQGDANNIAWTSDIKLDSSGNPYVAFSVRKGTAGLPGGQSGNDHRYYYARFNGSTWSVNQMAFAGSQLYVGEDDYTGLVALDPRDPNSVYISTNVNPYTNAALISTSDGLRHWELFHGVTQDNGATWNWLPITANSTFDNLRPVIPAWDDSNQALLWLRGTYTSYTNYDLDLVGSFTAVPEPTAMVLTGLVAATVCLRRKWGVRPRAKQWIDDPR